jgi:hypothetical protein
MTDAITTAPRKPPAEVPQLIYTLHWFDHLAWWLQEAAANPPPPQSRRDHVLLWTLWIPLLTLILFGFVALWCGLVGLRDPNLRTLCMLGMLFSLLFVWAVWRQRPFQALRSELTRDNAEAALRVKARSLEEAGEVINPDRIHWFLMDEEGFLEATELRRATAQGVAHYDYRETSCRWEFVDDVIVTSSHLFLVRKRGWVWIIPRRCFIDAVAVERFTAEVDRHRKAAAARLGQLAPPPDPQAIRTATVGDRSPSPVTGDRP